MSPNSPASKASREVANLSRGKNTHPCVWCQKIHDRLLVYTKIRFQLSYEWLNIIGPRLFSSACCHYIVAMLKDYVLQIKTFV